MKTHKCSLAFGIDQAKGMNTKAFHGAIATRDPSVRHCPHDIMQCLWLERDIIPERIMGALPLGNCPVGLWFYRMNKIGEFMCILNKKDGRVVAHQIEDPLFGVKLGGKSTNITHSIGGTRSSLNR